MTFQEAVKIIEDFADGFVGANLSLLDGLQFIQDDLSYCAEDEDASLFVTTEQVMAYHIVCREMREMFF